MSEKKVLKEIKDVFVSIDLQLNGIDKMVRDGLGLIEALGLKDQFETVSLASTTKVSSDNEENPLERMPEEFLSILEVYDDNSKVRTLMYMEKDWDVVNAVLRDNGFHWVSAGKESHWSK